MLDGGQIFVKEFRGVAIVLLEKFADVFQALRHSIRRQALHNTRP